MLRFIKIERRTLAGFHISVNLAIDSEVVCSIPYKGTVILPITEGRHTISFVASGRELPATEIPDGMDNLAFEDKRKVGIYGVALGLDCVGTFDASNVNVDECPFGAVKKCYDVYEAQKRAEILAYLNEFRAKPAALQAVTERVAEWILENELVHVKTRGHKVGPWHAMSLTLEFDHKNGTINCRNDGMQSIAHCLTINTTTGWSKERKYAFENALAERVANYWCQYSNNKRLEERTYSWDKPEVIFKTFEEDRAQWSYRLDPINGYWYSIKGLGYLNFYIKT